VLDHGARDLNYKAVTRKKWRRVGKATSHQRILDNIVLKLNLKMGGVNYDILRSERWLGGKRLFFGLALSHAQAPVKRSTGRASVKTFVRPQVIPVETAAPMVNAVKEALLTFSGLTSGGPTTRLESSLR
uniref:Transposase n=1 Tax=Globodera pallida TaxID=36090 RepID=A0A183CPU3_GLOPA